jgi:polyhydroxybutyrate depolymerase
MGLFPAVCIPALLATFTLLRQAPHEQAAAALAPGTYEFTLRHGGRERSYRVHVPPQAKERHPLPVVVNFHGGGGYARYHEAHSHMDETADREGFLAVYPNGTGKWRDRLLTFNAGTCCGSATDNHVDDVGFTLALLDDLARRTPLNPRRVYATGLSNGAMMAYRLAAEAPDRIAAIAPIAGGMVVDSFAPSHGMPIMHFHSLDDPRALYHGGLGAPFPFTHRRVLHPDMDRVLARWRARDGCPEEPVKAAPIIGSPGTRDSGQTAIKYVWGPCTTGAEMALWQFTGVGHVWPGGEQARLEGRFVGRSTHLVNANDEMWQFFKRFSR